MTPSPVRLAPPSSPDVSPRLARLPTYVFAWLDELKAEARANGATLIDLGIGSPDQPTPRPIVDAIAAAATSPMTHGYPDFRGSRAFRGAVAEFIERRYGIGFDPESEVLCLSGSKEGLAHITMAYVTTGDVSLVPDIHYPVHARATWLAGGDVHWLPLRAEHGFRPSFDGIPADVIDRTKLLFLNYPHNPTGAVATRELYEEAVAFCARHGILLVSDLAYGELGFDGYRAPSIFEIPGARDVAVEFHSFSKSFNMAGFRIGFAVGNAEHIQVLHALRTNMGYGTPTSIQEGAAFALAHVDELAPRVAATYQERRDLLYAGARALGWRAEPPRAAMYAWLPVPRGFTSQEWTRHVLDRSGVVVTPGNAFGPGGEGYFRMSLVAPPAVLESALARMQEGGIRA
jgi:LL-diaminopimelate aminotransferase